MPRRTLARAALDNRVVRTTTAIPMRNFDMAPSPSLIASLLDDAERKRKFPAAEQSVQATLSAPLGRIIIYVSEARTLAIRTQEGGHHADTTGVCGLRDLRGCRVHRNRRLSPTRATSDNAP